MTGMSIRREVLLIAMLALTVALPAPRLDAAEAVGENSSSRSCFLCPHPSLILGGRFHQNPRVNCPTREGGNDASSLCFVPKLHGGTGDAGR